MNIKTRPIYLLPAKDSLTYRLKVKGWKKMFHANGNEKKAGVAILISDKIDFNKRQRWVLRNNKGVNPARRYNICKYLCTQHRSP